MAGQPLEFSGFPLGLDNLHREDSLKLGSLRAAVNIDLDANGKPARRRGQQRVITGAVHSATACFDTLVAVVDGVLRAYTPDTYAVTATIRAGMSPRPLQWAHTPHRSFWTDGVQLRAFDATLVDTVAWPSEPGWMDSATVVQQGGLHAGNYQVVLTQIDAFGRESGAGRALLVEGVERNGGILLSGLPSPPEAVTLRVYATDANGDVLRFVGNATPGSPQYLVAWGPRGQNLETQWLMPMPAGQAVAFAMGRLWVASGRTLHFSEPLRYGATLPDNRITFGEDITLLAPTGSGPDAGLYVAAGKRTMYLAGANPKEAPLTAARATGAVSGTFRAVHTSAFSTAYESLPQTMAAVWVSSDGVFCLGLPGGSILPMTEKRVVLPRNADTGAIMLRNGDGLSQVVAAVSGGDTSSAGASDKLVGTIYRNGIAVVE
jgi:hypothetical protein